MKYKGVYYNKKACDEMTKAEFDFMMEISLAQAEKGESIPMEEAFDELLRGVDT